MIITKENNIFLYFCKKTNMKQIKKHMITHALKHIVFRIEELSGDNF